MKKGKKQEREHCITPLNQYYIPHSCITPLNQYLNGGRCNAGMGNVILIQWCNARIGNVLSLVSFLFSSLHPKCFRIKFLLLVYIRVDIRFKCACAKC